MNNLCEFYSNSNPWFFRLFEVFPFENQDVERDSIRSPPPKNINTSHRTCALAKVWLRSCQRRALRRGLHAANALNGSVVVSSSSTLFSSDGTRRLWAWNFARVASEMMGASARSLSVQLKDSRSR